MEPKARKSPLSLLDCLTATLLLSIALAIPAAAQPTPFANTGSLNVARFIHPATLLQDGRVLVSGGTTGTTCPNEPSVASSELYDPATGTWAYTGNLPGSTSAHRQTLLPDGRVLASGGVYSPSSCTGTLFLADAALYDPATELWTATGSLTIERVGHSATLLPDGTVLIAGGSSTAGQLASAEIYDPATGTWSATGSMSSVHHGHSAFLLATGKVLVVAGGNDVAELYDPATGTWSATGSLNVSRSGGVLLESGKVLIAGGYTPTGYVASAELYDPDSGTWTLTGSMSQSRAGMSLILLADGQVLAAGDQDSNSQTAELYDPDSGTWSLTGSMVAEPTRGTHSATRLQNGNVLIAGGRANNPGPRKTTSSELYLSTLPGPELEIEAEIPAAEGETVAVDIAFDAHDHTVAATIFSVDYDQNCLSFDDADVAPADGIPDGLTVLVPGAFTVTAFHDVGDADGEIDVLIADLAPPLGALPDGPVLTATFTATCFPSAPGHVDAAVAFSADPQASYSDDFAQDIDGTTDDGSVRIYPGPRGDCNFNGSVSAADLIADALEIFDGDGTFWGDVPGSTFAGSPVGCDANNDTAVTAGDISCTVLLIFGGDCEPQDFAQPRGRREPELQIDGRVRTRRGSMMRIPVRLRAGGHRLASVAFSLDLDPRRLRFDPTDYDGDGVADAVSFPQGRPWFAQAKYDARDHAGELDLVIGADSALGSGLVVEIEVEVLRGGPLSDGLDFSQAPAASFGDDAGRGVSGRASVRQGNPAGSFDPATPAMPAAAPEPRPAGGQDPALPTAPQPRPRPAGGR